MQVARARDVGLEPPAEIPASAVGADSVVPSDEVLERKLEETEDVIRTPPPEGTCVHFDIVYTPAGVTAIGHPGARSMGTELVGKVELENGEHVFVTWIVRPMEATTREHVDKLFARILDADGNTAQKTGMLAFGHEPNADADDGTFVGTVIEATRPDE